MINPRESTKEMMQLYSDGYSFEDIGNAYGLSRQAVWERLSRRSDFVSRTKKILPFIVADGIKFTPNKKGYYRATRRDRFISLHRYLYEREYGELPEDWDVHHIDENKQNNNLDNLQAMPKSDHTKYHQDKKKNENKKI